LTALFFWDTELCHRVFVVQCFETAVTSLSSVSHPVVCLTMEPWRWGHCMVSKFWAIDIQWWSSASQKNGVLNYTMSNPENSAILAILFYFDFLCSRTAGGTYGGHWTLIG